MHKQLMYGVELVVRANTKLATPLTFTLEVIGADASDSTKKRPMSLRGDEITALLMAMQLPDVPPEMAIAKR
jgi:hypothetical protein